MDTTWSTYIQRTGTLYESRKLKFSDVFRDSYTRFFNFPDGLNILEIGCGPGALTAALHRWYPRSEIYGIDRDSRFIEFAREHIPGVYYYEGDAANLPFEDEFFDVTISNTVAEHIDPEEFYPEQYRVLKKGGSCVVLSVRQDKRIYIPAPCIADESEWERNVWEAVKHKVGEMMKRHAVCAYPQTEAELPACMERYGFQSVSVEYVTTNLTPDHSGYSREMAHAMINADRRNELDNIDSWVLLAPDEVTPDVAERLKTLIHARYDRRIALYDSGIRQWDTNTSVTMMVKGIKSGVNSNLHLSVQ